MRVYSTMQIDLRPELTPAPTSIHPSTTPPKGLSQLRLGVNEELGMCGPLVGCMCGLGWFFCACQGLRKIVFARDGTSKLEAEAELEHT